LRESKPYSHKKDRLVVSKILLANSISTQHPDRFKL
jgi:hypothetical protein